MTDMTRILVAYGATAFVMVALDMLWLGVIAKPLYLQGIGHLMAAQPNVPVAVVFYLMYAVGLVAFAVWPTEAAPGWTQALVKGALLGFFAYATYDLTNLATLKNWPLGLSLIDIGWGTCVSGVSAAAGKWALDRFAPT
jgi:uncharacterized membrane protein